MRCCHISDSKATLVVAECRMSVIGCFGVYWNIVFYEVLLLGCNALEILYDAIVYVPIMAIEINRLPFFTKFMDCKKIYFQLKQKAGFCCC